MYYPFLRGKQFELLALRDFVEFNSGSFHVFPIIEPVKETFNSMKLAIQKMKEKSLIFGLVLNPQVGDIINRTDLIMRELQNELSDQTCWCPVFFVKDNFSVIAQKITDYNFQNVIIFYEGGDVQSQEFNTFFSLTQISKVIITDSRTVKRKLLSLNKELILMSDSFNQQAKNKDYLHVPEESFSEDFAFYQQEGFVGFSDYTTLPKSYIDGGLLPFAVAIHLTFKKNEEQIFIGHFVSNTNDDRTNVQGKFGEATEKAITFWDKQQLPRTKAIEKLSEYAKNAQYPGLGMVKKISILNHLELINSTIS
ncbi:MAG: sce7725 family protein [Bacteroidales bacterium]|nr:sce7725 family protein [Bacteroidales bacterium]